jgi:hypothetical protein
MQVCRGVFAVLGGGPELVTQQLRGVRPRCASLRSPLLLYQHSRHVSQHANDVNPPTPNLPAASSVFSYTPVLGGVALRRPSSLRVRLHGRSAARHVTSCRRDQCVIAHVHRDTFSCSGCLRLIWSSMAFDSLHVTAASGMRSNACTHANAERQTSASERSYLS